MREQVYFVRSGEHIKIGFSVDVPARMKELATGNPVQLELLAVVNGGRDLERAIHEALANHRSQREWFHDRPEVLQVMRAVIVDGHHAVAPFFKPRGQTIFQPSNVMPITPYVAPEDDDDYMLMHARWMACSDRADRLLNAVRLEEYVALRQIERDAGIAPGSLILGLFPYAVGLTLDSFRALLMEVRQAINRASDLMGCSGSFFPRPTEDGWFEKCGRVLTAAETRLAEDLGLKFESV